MACAGGEGAVRACMGFCALDFGVLVASRKGVKKDVFCYAFHQAKETPARRVFPDHLISKSLKYYCKPCSLLIRAERI